MIIKACTECRIRRHARSNDCVIISTREQHFAIRLGEYPIWNSRYSRYKRCSRYKISTRGRKLAAKRRELAAFVFVLLSISAIYVRPTSVLKSFCFFKRFLLRIVLYVPLVDGPDIISRAHLHLYDVKPSRETNLLFWFHFEIVNPSLSPMSMQVPVLRLNQVLKNQLLSRLPILW